MALPELDAFEAAATQLYASLASATATAQLPDCIAVMEPLNAFLYGSGPVPEHVQLAGLLKAAGEELRDRMRALRQQLDP